ncbi:MAG: sigma-54 dependent transcriptional regulator [Dongiaceae bacterium]
MSQESTILIVADDPDTWSSAMRVLEEEYQYETLICRDGAQAADSVQANDVDLVICEQTGAAFDGIKVLSGLRVSHPRVVRILVKDGGGAVWDKRAIMEAAIYQYLRLPIDPDQVGLVVKRALETRELARRHRLLSRELKFSEDSPLIDGKALPGLRSASHRFEKLVYASESMAELCELARQAAQTELPILIQGETGTGKELLARAIHFNSKRNQSPLLVQNCGGMPDELLQSELFGHKRGAFTGAVSDRLGLFRAAGGGTVFLDEISEVSPSFQVSLLRFLQDGEVKPLGSDQAVTCDVRIIAASNRPLAALVKAKEFRQDLYFRLKGFELEVPPLRRRREEIPVLAEFFAQKHAEAIGRRILGISADVLEQLKLHDFPGNVRELENEVRRMVALAKDGEFLTRRLLSPTITALAPQVPADDPIPDLLDGDTLKEKVEALEKHLVRDALARHRWNQSKAAAELGLSRVGLANKIKRYELET